jgi:ATP-dependent DNA helicase RecG
MSELSESIQYLKGVGPKLSVTFAKLGMQSQEDLLFYFPRSYEDRTHIPSLLENIQQKKDPVMLLGKITAVRLVRFNAAMHVFKAKLCDSSGCIWLNFFNQGFLQKTIQPETKLFVTGAFSEHHQNLELSVKNFEVADDADHALFIGRVVPLYGLTPGITQKKIRRVIWDLLQTHLSQLPDPLRDAALGLQEWLPLRQAVQNLHFPESRLLWKKAHDRMVLDEFFYLQYQVLFRKWRLQNQKQGIAFQKTGPLIEQYHAGLPYALTGAQKRVMSEILNDMGHDKPMNRLVQGDVGSGKTEVAVFAAIVAINSGYQVALLAPTEILATQHFLKIQKRLQQISISVDFLAGKVKGRAREEVLQKLKKGETRFLIGTHAIFQEGVEFQQLGLVIVDEQHRFGVGQRDSLRGKGVCADMLVMTATPIPRTLALTLYGDLDVSVIDELPPGRIAIQTFFNTLTHKTRVFQKLHEQMALGRQVYVVYPLIEVSEKLDLAAATAGFEELQKYFPDRAVALLHGRMRPEEKDGIMQNFRDRKVDILVSTTVIEVGVDVPNATVMVIVNADRFGLSQLHQLRGRVGRGAEASFCYLLASAKSPEAKKRMQAMVSTTDGFKLSEIDLEIRGQGDLLGTRQSGLPQLFLADLVKDFKILAVARNTAQKLLDADPELHQHAALKKEIEKRQLRQFDMEQLN